VLVGLAFQKLLIGGPQQVLQRLRILPALARFHNPSSQSTKPTKTEKIDLQTKWGTTLKKL
jgi:hypothetical protein